MTRAYDVIRNRRVIDTVFSDAAGRTKADREDDQRRSLINHDGYAPDIRVRERPQPRTIATTTGRRAPCPADVPRCEGCPHARHYGRSCETGCPCRRGALLTPADPVLPAIYAQPGYVHSYRDQAGNVATCETSTGREPMTRDPRAETCPPSQREARR
jgi:hypothetical protein